MDFDYCLIGTYTRTQRTTTNYMGMAYGSRIPDSKEGELNFDSETEWQPNQSHMMVCALMLMDL